MKKYDLIVVGAGHAGIEAAFVASRLGHCALLLTLSVDSIGKLSCNPAIGGVAKSHLVREVDIFKGAIASLTDASSLQYRILNKGKGKAVRATRVQVDKYAYAANARNLILSQPNITVIEAEVEEVLIKGNVVQGVNTNLGKFFSPSVIISPGTFLDGLIHIGLKHFRGGRLSEPASLRLYQSLSKRGISFKHFKTGTCARLDKRTLDCSKMIEQKPDKEAGPFSLFTGYKPYNKLSCFITYTNPKTHRIIKKNLKYSPLYQGIIRSKGVRYCPSLEDKVVKFSDKERHQVFIEPEAKDSVEIYPNGISTSLPLDVQYEFIHSIEGLEKAEIIRPGYGIEHAVIEARGLKPTLESKNIKGLFFAGQINGTTGYEEAAAQGLLAGINAALGVRKKPSFILTRQESFIGLLVDELTRKGTDEPYRMFTSRSEYRLLLREDNAHLRLYRRAFGLGLLSEEDFSRIRQEEESIKAEVSRLKKFKVFDILKRPGTSYKDLSKAGYPHQAVSSSVVEQVEIEVKYDGFIKRELHQAEELKKIERIKIPKNIFYKGIPGLSKEIIQKLEEEGPQNLLQAQGISGVTPAAILILLHHIKKGHKVA